MSLLADGVLVAGVAVLL
ncbi:TPA: DUF3927 domain-containing protein [Salmonella enterica]|uniref:DUF3927 domain-containing protein n=1 Tax=Salmonella enterica TaxID=28901 RepID=A0A744C0N9_SALER|nr:DUF3927 domain-containing protein [Salmonella enterica]HAF2396298.1 DUF3927 domain-containing protein [Salmonella enterica]